LKLLFFPAGFEWVGWNNDSVGVSGKPVELTFQFDNVRNFSAMVLHTNNMFTKGVQVSVATSSVS
jgi:discoidin domain receptor family member 2